MPAAKGPGGVYESELVSSDVPPDGAAYQSTTKPTPAVTESAGIATPSQMEGLLAPPAKGTDGQLQLGAVILICLIQLAVEEAVIIILVSAGIRSMINVPALPVTVPAVAVTFAASEVTVTE